MQINKEQIKPVRRPARIGTVVNPIPLSTMFSMEQELKKLVNLFAAASFMLADYDVQTLSHLRRKYAEIKQEMTGYLQAQKSRPSIRGQHMLHQQSQKLVRLEPELQDLRIRLDRLKDRLFNRNKGKLRLL